jgi:4-alpha-glucanotransferase
MAADAESALASSSSSRNNPLLHRVSSLLSSNMRDKQTHAALETLAEFGLASTSSTTTTTHASTSALRRDVEHRMQQSARAFLAAFAQVNEVRKKDEIADENQV